MADTFDFRQYLPKDILEEVNEDDESDDDILGEVSSDEEEMANALMVGNGGDSGDDSDGRLFTFPCGQLDSQLSH